MSSNVSSREYILKKVRAALANNLKQADPENVSLQSIFTKSPEEDLSVIFAENLLKTMGEFVYCENRDEFLSSFKAFISQRNIRKIHIWEEEIYQLIKGSEIEAISSEEDFIEEVEAGATTCEALLARTGSILISSATNSGRRLSVYPPTHIVLAYTSQIVPDLKDSFALIKKKYKQNFPSMISLITGPSRTADIEKTLVLGAHGPKELIVFLIDDTSEN